MDFIYKLKVKEDETILLKYLDQAFESLLKRFKNPVFVLACTELSIFSEHLERKYNIIDSANIIVQSAIKRAGFQVID